MKSSSTKSSSFRRRLLLGAGFLTLLGSLAAAASSCGSLPDIEGGQCGNRVVEPNNGEACEEPSRDAGLDGAVYGKCGLPGSYAPCRYICNEVPCDPGYGCGLDGVCRRSDGLSDLPISIGGLGAQQLLRGDFDGDGRFEIVAADGNVATVYFLTTEGFISSSKAFPYAAGTPAIGDLDGDGLSDMALNLGYTMAIWLGQEDRTLIPKTYPMMYAGPSTQRLIPLGSYTDDGYILALTEAMEDNAASFIELGPDGSHRLIKANTQNFSPGKQHGTVALKAIDEPGKSCGMLISELAAVMGQPLTMNRVFAAKRCNGDPGFELPWDIKLGAKSPWAGVYLQDIDKDGTDELLYGTDDGTFQRLMVETFNVLGKPAGSPQPYLEHEAGNCLSSPATLASPPLAFADLNGDTQADFVDSRGMLLSNSQANPKPYQRICHSYSVLDPMNPMAPRVSWTSAFVGDVNGDGFADLIASRKNDNILDWWTWKPSGLETVSLSVPGPVQDLVGGDLDGDMVSDLVFRLVPPLEDSFGPTRIYAMFGNRFTLPSPPQSIGNISGAKQLLVGRFQGANQLGQPDLYDDLLILADERMGMGPNGISTGESPLTLIQGNPTRTLVAPLLLQEDTHADLNVAETPGSSSGREIHALTISDFGIPENRMDLLESASATIVVAAGTKIWTAGIQRSGSSSMVKDNVDVGNNSVLLAPVDEIKSASTMKLGVFADSMNGPTRWFITHFAMAAGMEQFTDSYDDREELKPKVRLPNKNQVKVPYVFADLDANGRRDVVVLADDAAGGTSGGRTVIIYWNGDTTESSDAFDLDKQTEYTFTPADDTPAMNGGMNGAQPLPPIQDIAALNYDADKFLELAILVSGRIYIAKIDLLDPKKYPTPTVTERRNLSLLNDKQSIATIQGGTALLALDANSDGIDDLVVGDPGKLLLFFGAEKQNQ